MGYVFVHKIIILVSACKPCYSCILKLNLLEHTPASVVKRILAIYAAFTSKRRL